NVAPGETSRERKIAIAQRHAAELEVMIERRDRDLTALPPHSRWSRVRRVEIDRPTAGLFACVDDVDAAVAVVVDRFAPHLVVMRGAEAIRVRAAQFVGAAEHGVVERRLEIEDKVAAAARAISRGPQLRSDLEKEVGPTIAGDVREALPR